MGSPDIKLPGNVSCCGGEIQNVKMQSLAEPPGTPGLGQFWFDSTNNKPVWWNGTVAKDFGKEYSNGTGLTLTGTTFAVDSSVVALKSDITTVYKAAGPVASASDLPTLSASVLGNVYNVTTSFNTTSDFVEGSGKPIPVGNDIAVVDVGSGSSHSYKFSVMGDFIDLSSYQLANTAVTHTASTAVGSATKGVYIASNGTATEMTYSLNKDVPSDAVFTDTTYTFSTGLTNTSGTITVTDYSKLTKKITATNGALTQSNGVCTWTITNSLGTADVQVSIYEVGTNKQTIVYPNVEATSSTVTVTLLSASNISAGAYKAVIVG